MRIKEKIVSIVLKNSEKGTHVGWSEFVTISFKCLQLAEVRGIRVRVTNQNKSSESITTNKSGEQTSKRIKLQKIYKQ